MSYLHFRRRLFAFTAGTVFAIGCNSPIQSIPALETQEEFDDRKQPVVSMAYSPDGTHLAACHYFIWPSDVRVSPAGIGPSPSQIWVWSISERACIAGFPGDDSTTYKPIQFSNDGTQLVVPRRTGLTVWQTANAAVRQIEMSRPFAISTENCLVAIEGESSDSLKITNFETAEDTGSISNAGQKQNAATFSPDGQLLATYGMTDQFLINHIMVWDVASSRLKFKRKVEPTLGRKYCRIAPNNTFLAYACTESRDLSIFDLETESLQTTLDMQSSDVWNIAISPDNRLVAACTEPAKDSDSDAIVWDVSSGKQVAHVVDESTAGMTALAFSPDGKLLATGDWNGQIKFWKLGAGVLAAEGTAVP